MTSPPPPTVQERIQTLTDVHDRLHALRRVPAMLLRPPSSLSGFPPPFDPTDLAATFDSTPAHDLSALKGFVELLCSDEVQEALGAARASQDADPSELGLSCRRARTPKRPEPSPAGSPQPYVPPPPRSGSMFGPAEDDPPPMRAESLLAFVRAFNRGDATAGECKLALWSRTQTGGGLASPVVLRFIIPDVLTAYVSLTFARLQDPLVVESVAAFGPRERKLPHERSDYVAFQGLSQYVTKMVLSHPRVPVQVLMGVLVCYRGLFVDRCTACQRVLSAEGHVPPVARLWVCEDGGGHWEARHAGCVYG